MFRWKCYPTTKGSIKLVNKMRCLSDSRPIIFRRIVEYISLKRVIITKYGLHFLEIPAKRADYPNLPHLLVVLRSSVAQANENMLSPYPLPEMYEGFNEALGS